MRMNLVAAAVVLMLSASPILASDSCLRQVIRATADVRVSDDSTFGIESYFGAVDQAAIRFVDDHDQVIAVEGDLAWVSQDGKVQPGEDVHKMFALGHQYHALLLNFDSITDGVRQAKEISFGGASRTGLSGKSPYGGSMQLIAGNGKRRPEGLVFELPGSPRIEVHFEDWRRLDDTDVPFRLRIDDGRSLFVYSYTEIDISHDNATWFHDHVPAPDIEQVLAGRAEVIGSLGECGVLPRGR